MSKFSNDTCPERKAPERDGVCPKCGWQVVRVWKFNVLSVRYETQSVRCLAPNCDYRITRA